MQILSFIKKHQRCIFVIFAIVIITLFLHIPNNEKAEVSVYNKVTSFFDGTSTEIKEENYLGIAYKVTKKQYTFSTDNFLDYSLNP